MEGPHLPCHTVVTCGSTRGFGPEGGVGDCSGVWVRSLSPSLGPCEVGPVPGEVECINCCPLPRRPRTSAPTCRPRPPAPLPHTQPVRILQVTAANSLLWTKWQSIVLIRSSQTGAPLASPPPQIPASHLGLIHRQTHTHVVEFLHCLVVF